MKIFFHNVATPILLLIILIFQPIFTQISLDDSNWRKELQILIGFRGGDIDGVMGVETFNALKKFAEIHELTDVVLRGEFEDIEYWGFEQYLIKYHGYWIRELKNNRIYNDIHDKEYLRQGDETLYFFEGAIQNAKLEIERLNIAKEKARRVAKEKKELYEWNAEKEEAERLTAELQEAIMVASLEAEKWSLEMLRAKRFAEEREQLDRLTARKSEAVKLTYELEDIILSAKREIDHLIEENKKMKNLIESSAKTEIMAEELIRELKNTNENLEVAQGKIQDLSSRNDTLEVKLQNAKIDIENMLKNASFNMDGFSRGNDSTDSSNKWYKRFRININNHNLISMVNDSYAVNPTIALDIHYGLNWKTKLFNKDIDWNINLEYAPLFTYGGDQTDAIFLSLGNQFSFKWNLLAGTKIGFASLSKYTNSNYIVLSSDINYKIPFRYKIISASCFIAPQLMQSFGGETSQLLMPWNMGIRFHLDF